MWLRLDSFFDRMEQTLCALKRRCKSAANQKLMHDYMRLYGYANIYLWHISLALAVSQPHFFLQSYTHTHQHTLTNAFALCVWECVDVSAMVNRHGLPLMTRQNLHLYDRFNRLFKSHRHRCGRCALHEFFCYFCCRLSQNQTNKRTEIKCWLFFFPLSQLK